MSQNFAAYLEIEFLRITIPPALLNHEYGFIWFSRQLCVLSRVKGPLGKASWFTAPATAGGPGR